MDQSSKYGRYFWAEFLPGIDQTIGAALAALAKREKELPSPPEDTPAFEAGQRLHQVEGRIQELPGSLSGPEQTLAEADSLFQRGEEEWREYLSAIEALRRRLADWVGRAIG